MATAIQKRKRIVLSIEDKLKICDLVKKGRALSSVAAEYNVGKSTVHDIVRNKEKLKNFQTEVQDNDCIKRRKIVRRADYDELDKAVFLWFLQQRCKGAPISGPLLMAKAHQLFPLVYPDKRDPGSFKAGTGWLKRFKDRHGVRSLSIQGESLSAVTERVGVFKDRLLGTMEEKVLTLSQVFNRDETELYWRLMPNKTLVSSREKVAKGFKRGDKDDGDKEEEEETTPAISHAQACSALETVLAYVQEQPEIPTSTTVMLNNLLIETSKQISTSRKQTKLTDYFTHMAGP